MRITASTHIVDNLCSPFTDEANLMKRFGFEGIDFNLNLDYEKCLGLAWQDKAELFAEQSYENDMPVVQTHLPYSYPIGGGDEEKRKFLENTKKAILISEILGAPYAVFHAINDYNGKGGYELTDEIYRPIVDFAYEHNVEPLVEIMPNFCTFPITAESLCRIADKLEIGVCWDFGHPNVNKYHLDNDQRDEIRLVGSRIKALHVNDNFGGRPDEHLPPFLGSIDWQSHIPVLKEIGYEGDFNYEVLPRRIPDYMTGWLCEYMIKVGKNLIQLCL